MGGPIRRGLGWALLTLALAPGSALADGRNPASLLVFPEFDNATANRFALITITNTCTDLVDGSVWVEVVWVASGQSVAPPCFETNATYHLTPNDTLTLLSTQANPNPERGWVYAFAKDVQGRAISFDWLIGDDLLVDGVFLLDWSVTPQSFRALPELRQPTDLDFDGNLDLDGAEYEAAPDRILVPRFLAQGTLATSQLILINLTGGGAFTALVDFLIYNDNEEVFSRNYLFRCWAKLPLASISGAFTQNYITNATLQDPFEILGLPQLDSGWFEIDGATAFSSATQFQDPAILAFLVERGSTGSGAEAPFELGRQTNGALLPLGVLGDVD